MFAKFAGFWIKNQKLTVVIVSAILLMWVFWRIVIPKQYNPKIEAPAFNIMVPAPWYSPQEVSELVVKPLENKIAEIDGVDDIFGYAENNRASVMVSFKVGEDKEKSTIKIYNKLFSNLRLKPYGVGDPIISNIDPEELPVYSFALSRVDAHEKSNEENNTTNIALRKTALDLIEELKHVKNVRGFFLVGGDKETITIAFDLERAKLKNISLPVVLNQIKKNNLSLSVGNLHLKDQVWSINFDGNLSDLEDIRHLVVGSFQWKNVYLEDIATITFAIPEELSSTWLRDKDLKIQYNKNTLFVGIAKKDGTNSVEVVRAIEKKISKLQQKLEGKYEITKVQDLGAKAEKATNMLLVNLIQSIIIVLIILTIILWFHNALNVAITIPLTLAVIFLYALVVGDNVNRITLFALILVLWMMVDDATVVVENINRKLAEVKVEWFKDTDQDSKNWVHIKKAQLNAIFQAIREVELGVILSTVTRLLAFGAMFFVTGMMGSYMQPIPKYAIVAMITSTIVALSINPFLTDLFYNIFGKKKKNEEKNIQEQKWKIALIFSKIDVYKKKLKVQLKDLEEKSKIYQEKAKTKYNAFLHYFLDEKFPKRVKFFKIGFWITLVLFVVVPPALLIFKMRMLPKSNQNQIFIWVDMPENSSYTHTRDAGEKLNQFLVKNYGANQNKNKDSYIKDNKILEQIATWNGIAPMPEFSNVFRRSMVRVGEKYISMKLELVDKHKRAISSEAFVISVRPEIQKFVADTIPWASLRILEEPPGPPTQATFQLKIQGESSLKYSDIEQFTQLISAKLQPMFAQQNVVDVDTSVSSYKNSYQIKFDHKRAARLGISSENVSQTLYGLFSGIPMTIYHNSKNKEGVNLYLVAKKEQKDSQKIFEQLVFQNNQWVSVPFSEVAELVITEDTHPIYSDEKSPTAYIYGEMWDNSIIYPSIMTLRLLLDDNFWEDKYEVVEWNPYKVIVKDLLTNEEYIIKIAGEWELTLDTFRDLGLAMLIAFLAIYFVMVAQFKSFGTWWVVMLSFLFGFFWVFPLFTLLYLFTNEYFSATSMIGVIALAGIVVGNAILLLEYIVILVKKEKVALKEAVIQAGWVRMKPIIITSLTTIFGATTILWDPVWSGLAYAIIGGLISSSILTPLILPIFLYGSLKDNKELFEE